MKKVTAKHFYGMDIGTLLQAFRDKDVIFAKMANSGAKDVEVAITELNNGFNVVIQRSMFADVPSVLKSLLGEWNTVKQVESWTGDAERGFVCLLSIEITGVPASVSGTMKVTSNGILTTNLIELEVKSGVPLLGGQLEKFVATSIEKSAKQEFEFIKHFLA